MAADIHRMSAIILPKLPKALVSRGNVGHFGPNEGSGCRVLVAAGDLRNTKPSTRLIWQQLSFS